jgi:hypothetical protein
VTRRLSLIAALCLLAALLTACGGSDTLALDPVAEAAERTRQEGSAKVVMTMSAEATGSEAFAMTGTGIGVFNNDDGSGRMDFTIEVEGEQADFESVFVMPVMYMRSSVFAGELPDGKSWMKIDLLRAGKELGFDMNALTGSKPMDSLAALGSTSGDIEEVGVETVRGVSATHYRAEIDFEKAAAEGPKEFRESMSRLVELTGMSTVPVEVWIDDEGLVRRFTQTWNQKLPGEPGRMHTEMTMELYDFGPRIEVDAPPEEEVFDATALAGAGPGG